MVQNPNRFKINFDARLLFFGLIIGLFFINYYSKTMFFRPSGTHQWRQADCLSIAKNYYEEGMHFFEPKIHYAGVSNGKAVSECPLLNYSAAALWKVFGEKEFIYRLLEYFIFIIAMYVFFIGMLKKFASPLLAFFSVGLLLTSPLLVFYSLNFIADVPALSIGIISFCLFYRFYENKQMKYFYSALFFGTLAVLLKASALMGLGILFFFSLLDLFGLTQKFKTEKLFSKKVMPGIALFLSAFILVAWYKFALQYNNNNNNNVFLLTVLPIWELDQVEIIKNLKLLFNVLFPVFLNKPTLFLFLVIVLFVIAKFKQLPVFLKYAFVFTAVFFLAYLLFFFQVFSVHDYYLSNLMIFPVVALFCFADLIVKSEWLINNKTFARSFLILFLLFNSMHAAAIYRLRMIEDDKLASWFPFVSAEDENLAKYLFWDYGNAIKRIENFGPVLRAHGIKREDKVISTPDQSFDISLYFMDQKGYTIAKHHFIEDTLVLEKGMKNKAQYLIMSDTTLKAQRTFQRMANRLEPFFIENKVQVFKIK